MKRLTEEVIPGSGVSGIVIHGSGRHFSSGADLDDIIGAIKENAVHECLLYEERRPSTLLDNLMTFRFFEDLEIPVVAAIRGVCLGSALELALFCHCRICGEGSVLGLPEATFGLLPGCGGIQKLRALAGLPRALELILSGTTFSTDDALRWGIIDSIVPKESTVGAAVNFIRAVGSSYQRACIGSYIHKYLRRDGWHP
ncbi:MAG TPA: enoyl-CoA hydratase/isomerase family protein [Spirochaetota bacterium]|nr:enoyl-CoA hydratase/isomerase family protein [Spirochaetota bacterium]